MDHGSTSYYYPVAGARPSLMDRLTAGLIGARDWLDARGRLAWIAAMVAGFIFVWPVGLAILLYMIGSNRMFSCSNRNRGMARRVSDSTGNSAFDAYRAETLKRLEDEHQEFQSFLARLREARDKSEFDQFMADRRGQKNAGDEPRDA